MSSCNRAAAVVLALVFAFLISQGYAQDTIVPAIIAFGDSGLDVGNNEHLPTKYKANYSPYGMDFLNHKPTGRFCNGKLISDITAETLGFKTYPPAYLSSDASEENLLTGVSFASAASGFDNEISKANNAIPLYQQLKYFKEYKTKLAKVAGTNKSISIIKDALYLLSAGTTDFLLNYYTNPKINKVYSPDQYGSILAGAFSSFIKDLYGLGARRVGVTSLPPLGCVPAASALFGHDKNGCASRINHDAQKFNHKINFTAANLQEQLPGLKIVVFDIFKPLYDLVASPSNYGFVEARRSCCETRNAGAITEALLCNSKSAGSCPNATQFVFWDGVHTSEAANQVIADALLAQGFSLI